MKVAAPEKLSWVCGLVCFGSIIFCFWNAVSRLKEGKGLLGWADHFGLLCGLCSILVGQLVLFGYQFIHRVILHQKENIQMKEISYPRTFFEDLIHHFSNPGAFILMVPYLTLTWTFQIMPESYYNYDAPLNWMNVLLQLLVVDFFTYTNHVAEHAFPKLYILSHKPHHRFINPQLFNAFDGSLLDTVFLILFPLYTTANLLHVSNWDYLAFGTVYSVHFMLIHSEHEHMFDPILKLFLVNVAEDHHVHHAIFNYNFAHFFTIYDRLCGTYRDGSTCRGFRSCPASNSPNQKVWPSHLITPLETPGMESKEEWSIQTGGKVDSGNGLGRAIWVPPSSPSGIGIGGDREEDESCFSFDRRVNSNSCDLIYRDLLLNQNKIMDCDLPQGDDAATAALRGSMFYTRLQTEEGFWPGDYGGPLFLLPGLVIACHVTNIDFGSVRRSAMLRYLLNHQQVDGGWGTHIEGKSTMFGSTLNYTAARLLGLGKNTDEAIRAREFIHEYDGAISAPQWAKFWLAVLGVYEWSGVNPAPPEFWLLPDWTPYHPARMWCQCRAVYLPMSVLFGDKYVYQNANRDPLILSLRKELYPMDYDSISWGSFSIRECIAPMDLYNPQTLFITAANSLLHYTLENPLFRKLFSFPLDSLRRRSIEEAYVQICAEDRNTNWVDIGPVNKAFHIVATYAKFGPESPNFKRHVPRILDYLWVAEDGMKMQGYNGSTFWETAFACQALGYTLKATESYPESALHGRSVVQKSLAQAARFTDSMQVKEDVSDRKRYFRDPSAGGWPFSNSDNGWHVSDCTAEGLKTVFLLEFLLEDHPTSARFGEEAQKERKGALFVGQERLERAVSILLGMQNSDNGWPAYEPIRGYNWYELLNPSQVFGDIMIDYSYVECSSACIQALCEFSSRFPESPFSPKSLEAVQRGVEFILKKQEPNGSFYGSWGVCFTYGGWFAFEGLVTALSHSSLSLSPQIRHQCEQVLLKACKFFLSKQLDDGGWGESVESCSDKVWVPCSQGSQVVQTAWVLLGFVRFLEYMELRQGAEFEREKVVCSTKRAAELIQKRQLPNGDFPQECIPGVFSKTCAISFTSYRNVFPVWALARFAQLFPQSN